MAELAPQDKGGSYVRLSYNFDGRIGDTNFPDEAGRYHLYGGNACPWCHRAVLALNLLEVTKEEVSVTYLEDDPVRASRGGWVVSSSSFDPLKCSDLREVYDLLSPNYKGRCTAPLLVDLKSRRIVSNESADIVRTLNTASFGNKKTRADLYPEYLRNEIDQTNQWIYRLLNNGVYRCGFSTTQTSYDAAARDVREGLTRVDALLENQEFLCGDVFTEADLRLLPTMLRFDGAYAPLFKAGGAHTR